MARTLRLVEYDATWSAQFAAESARIAALIGDHVRAIEHVGSTSVPGMISKPVIDISVAVSSEADADACIAPLVALGYEYRGPYGEDPRRRYYVRDADGKRFAHIHLYILPAPAWTEQLIFRDALRADPVLAAAYADEKRRIAAEVAWDKRAYSEAKGPFVEAALARLRREARMNGLRSASTRDQLGPIHTRPPMAKKSTRARKTVKKRPAKAPAARKHVPTRGLYGWITHTDLASTNPSATKAWCQKVMGWTFMPTFPMPDGSEYHLFAYSEKGGGGIRSTNPSELPGSIPYVHVEDAQTAFDTAIREGAEEMMAPSRVMEGVTVAIVRAPGGVVIGFSGP